LLDEGAGGGGAPHHLTSWQHLLAGGPLGGRSWAERMMRRIQAEHQGNNIRQGHLENLGLNIERSR